MVEIKGVTKTFTGRKETVTAVDNASFSIKAGEVFGLVGTNGAGKTTLMRMIATMLKPTTGSIEVLGKDVVKEPEAARKNIGILFGSEAGLYDRLTAYENIEYFAKLNGLTDAECEERIAKLAKFFGMEDYINRPCGRFSKGMKQKTCFARSIVHEPPVMLFDEPTSGLDIVAAEEVIEFIKQCKSNGKAVLLSSHDMAEVNELCDRVAIIDKGKILETGGIDELTEKYGGSLKEIFFKLIKGGEGQ